MQRITFTVAAACALWLGSAIFAIEIVTADQPHSLAFAEEVEAKTSSDKAPKASEKQAELSDNDRARQLRANIKALAPMHKKLGKPSPGD